jgi:glycosyltransferase involved in cell wall biosynthesis
MSSRIVINLVGKHNAYGLMYDARILQEVLEQSGFEVRFINADFFSGRNFWQRVWGRIGPVLLGCAYFLRLRPRADLNIFLEWLPRQMFYAAPRHVLIPNQEWYEEEDRYLLPRFELVICKTRAAEEIFSRAGARAAFSGFTSLDRRVSPAPTQAREFLMVTGKVLGVAGRVLELWARHPEWPQLTLSSRFIPPDADLPNVRLIRDYIPAEEIFRLQNETLFHLCVTPAEGFGHKMVEGMSCGAVVLAVDAPPMNEVAQPGRSLLVKWNRSNPLRLGTEYHFDEVDLERAIEHALRLKPEEIAALSANARSWFEQNDRVFRESFCTLLRDKMQL